MNRDIALRDGDGSWAVGPHLGESDLLLDGRRANPGLDLTRLLRIINEWKWLVIGAAALGLALGVLLTLLTTPQYRAVVTLEVNPPRVEILDSEEQSVSSGITAWDFVTTQVGLLQSRSLAERVAQDLNLANNENFADQEADPAVRVRQATDEISKNLAVSPAEGQLIEFQYVSESPEMAAQIANAYGEAFINTTLQRRYEASAYARNFLERQIAKTRGDLERSERQLVSYAQSQGIIDTSDSGGEGASATGGDASSLQGQSLIALNQALAEATARRVAAEGAYRQSRRVGNTSEVTGSTQLLRQSRAQLEAEYQEKRTLMKPEHPEMVSLRSRIEELDRQIARESSTVANSASNSLLAEYRGALAAEQALRNRVSQLKGDVLDLRGRSIRYTILQREVDTNRALYDALLQRYKEIGVAGGIGSAPVTIVDRAEVPGAPFKPNLVWNLLIGLVLGTIIGLVAAIALEFINDTIKTRADVREKLGLACLGVVPRRPRKATLIDELDDPASPTSEAYSTVATSLRFSTDHGVPKVLLLTSARAAEGKSSSALSLSRNFARQGGKVLLIDSDLRKPVFRGSSDKSGLTRLLTSDGNVADHVTPTQFENLWLLPCGPIPPNPADLLSTGRFRAILREAGTQFDTIVVDAPPVLGMADSALLASIVNDVVLIIESGKTRTSAAREAIQRIRTAGGNILGVTLTKSKEEKSSYGYGYGSYRYGAVDRRRDEVMMLGHQDEA